VTISSQSSDANAVKWLLRGDVSIQYQTRRDLLDQECPALRTRIASEGWGARFLRKRHPDGHWGQRFYQPKWTSTHYTLLDLMHLGISPDNKLIKQSINSVACTEKRQDGGIGPGRKPPVSDVCVNGMFLNYATYFGTDPKLLESVVDFILNERMPDGGFNCYSNSKISCTHSSVHSTLSVLEGIRQYSVGNYRYRIRSLHSAERSATEFLLKHKLFKSHRTGKIMDKKMLMLSFPSRWRFDILRALDYFRLSGAKYDSRLDDAIEVLLSKRRADGLWPVQARHPGQTHFEMEKTGKPSRWNTLRALRILKHYGIDS